MYSDIRGKYKALKEAYRLAKKGDEKYYSLLLKANYYSQKEGIFLPESLFKRMEEIYRVNNLINESEEKVKKAIDNSEENVKKAITIALNDPNYRLSVKEIK